MVKYALAAIALAAVAAGPAGAAPAGDSVAAVVQRHQDAFARKDIKALLADYADDAVIVLPSSLPSGKAKIGAMFQSYFASSPTSTNFDVKLDRIEGDIGVTKWVSNPGTPKATAGNDVFVVRGGKIRFQATTNVHPVAQAAAK